jgi:hypothetical protein
MGAWQYSPPLPCIRHTARRQAFQAFCLGAAEGTRYRALTVRRGGWVGSDFVIGQAATCDHSHVWSAQRDISSVSFC